jgi:hypothetical protein
MWIGILYIKRRRNQCKGDARTDAEYGMQLHEPHEFILKLLITNINTKFKVMNKRNE